MSSKNICLECSVSFNGASEYYSVLPQIPCPKCGASMTWMPHRFRPPKKQDKEGWATVRYLVEHGFKYHHVYEVIPDDPKGASRIALYPENLRDAKEFVEKHKK